MFQLRELRRERQAKVTEARALSDDANTKRNWTPALDAKVKGLLDEVEALDDKIHQHERLRDMVNSNIMSGANGSDREALASLGAFARRGDTSGFQNAMTEDPSSAGVLVAVEQGPIAQVALGYCPLRGICRVESIGTAPGSYSIPLILDGAATAWVDETETRSETAAPRITAITFPDGEVTALALASQWAIEDTVVGGIMADALGSAFGRAEQAAFVRGSGSKMPFGILAAHTTTESDADRDFDTIKHLATGTGVATVLADDLMRLVYDLKPEYRQNGTWVMTSATLGAIRGLKDSTGRFLWEPSLTPGQPSTLLGFPVCEVNDWDEVATGKFPVAFGDFKRAYCIVDRTMAIIRDPYSAKPFVQIYGRKRVSGNVLDACAIRLLKMTA